MSSVPFANIQSHIVTVTAADRCYCKFFHYLLHCPNSLIRHRKYALRVQFPFPWPGSPCMICILRALSSFIISSVSCPASLEQEKVSLSWYQKRVAIIPLSRPFEAGWKGCWCRRPRRPTLMVQQGGWWERAQRGWSLGLMQHPWPRGHRHCAMVDP